MHNIFEQISNEAEFNKEKDHVVICFPSEKLEFCFNTTRGRVLVPHKSQAVIAAVTGRPVRYKTSDINSTNRVFEWLGIKYTVDYKRVEKHETSTLKDGVISFF